MTASSKHILFVNHTRALHGSERVMLETLRSCRAQGWRITVVLPKNKPDEGLAQALKNEADILYLNYKNSGEGFLRTLAIELYNLPAVIRLSRWIRQNHVDLIYSNTSVNLLGIEAAKRTHTPHIWHWHEVPDKTFGWSKASIRFLRYWSRFSNRLIFISKTQQQLWERTLEIQIPSAQVIYNPVRAIHSKPTPHKGLNVGYIGSFAIRKNLPLLIQTVTDLAQDHNIHLHLYGATTPYANTSVLTVHPFTEDVATAYANLDIFVLPSWSETMPLVVLEAMQAGVCVIQTVHSGMTELMQDGQQCLFIHPEDPDSLRNALIRCLDNDYRTQLATCGQQFAAQWLAQNNYAHDIIFVFKSLIN